ncbi:Mechanosensitive ion channel protein MscS [Georgfuchsia toluolica]|uniref:Mechanosensitive ion channel protein MscS n=1 Tax=Georgfuchsia toluolica TaxID=424218 RepID=A0A916N0B4_9PROT|nr:mechanosensitive ion channel family protein [Georgfuchsia toluolica]CAG4883748.1 Mechanosensitive ion channel protein MscS [Georgfuchsia toluolica]
MQKHIDSILALAMGHTDTIARVAVILILTSILLKLTQRIIPRLRDYIAAQQSSREDSQRILTLSRVLRYSVNVAIVAVAAILVLGEFGISVAPILGAAGVIGLAIGFGAQSLVKDYFTGFFLLLENQIRHGDVVEAGGKAGLVEELTLRYLKLRDYSGNVHYIPNGTISVVTNMSLGYAYAVIDASISYDTDIDHAIAAMREVGEDMRHGSDLRDKILDALEIAGVDDWADSSIVIRCRFKVVPLEQWNVRREFLKRLKEAFDRANIEIPFPHLKIITAAIDSGTNK